MGIIFYSQDSIQAVNNFHFFMRYTSVNPPIVRIRKQCEFTELYENCVPKICQNFYSSNFSRIFEIIFCLTQISCNVRNSCAMYIHTIQTSCLKIYPWHYRCIAGVLLYVDGTHYLLDQVPKLVSRFGIMNRMLFKEKFRL